MGIFLSLLQDLASGMDDDSGYDSDYDSDMDYREEMASRRSSGGLDGVSDDLRRVSTGTVEVLGYAQSGDEEAALGTERLPNIHRQGRPSQNFLWRYEISPTPRRRICWKHEEYPSPTSPITALFQASLARIDP